MSTRLTPDVAAGLFFIAIGAFFLVAGMDLPFGTSWRRLGPGAFPTLIAGLLVVIGLVITGQGLVKGAGKGIGLRPAKLAIITLGIIAFGLTVRGAGLLAATALAAGIASFARPPRSAARLALYLVFLAGATGLVFVTGLGMNVPLVGPWLRF